MTLIAVIVVVVVALPREESGMKAAQPVYDRMLAGMTRPGLVLHTTYTVYDCDHTKAWIDARADVVVYEFHYLCDDDEGVDNRVVRSTGACRGTVSAVVTFFLGCAPNEDVELSVIEEDQYEGRPAITLQATGQFYGIDSRVEFDEKLYVDVETGLPIATVRDVRDFYGGDPPPVSERIVTTYAHEFVERSTLPDDFFEQADSSDSGR